MSIRGTLGDRRRVLALVLVPTTLVLACATEPLVDVRGPDDQLRLRVHVERALTAEARREGLAGRAPLDEGQGLLLVYPVEGEACIENTFVDFALDAVFADAAGEVVAVERAIAARDATPRCHAPVARVLEVAAGVALSVEVGDVLEESP